MCIPYPLKYCTRWLDNVSDNNHQQTFHRTVAWYRKHFTPSAEWSGKKLFLEFEGVMQVTTVYVNGTNMGTHRISGYTPFHFDITTAVVSGQDNVIAVLVDNTISQDSPPDPGMKDYIQFGGLYRDVYLNVLNPVHVTFPWESTTAGVTISTPSPSAGSATVRVRTSVKNESPADKSITVQSTVLDSSGAVVKQMELAQTIAAGATSVFSHTSTAIASPKLWSTTAPYLYKVFTRVIDGGQIVDSCVNRFGIRWVGFSTSSGFTLNGSPIKLQGENRHQQWPFVGESVPNLYQAFDAKMLRACGNIVRTSHYPQDPAFFDACDEIGLLIDAAPPTWYNADAQALPKTGPWWGNLEEAFRREIRRDRNHPSIIIWEAYVNHATACEAVLSDVAHLEDSSGRLLGLCDFTHPMCYGTAMAGSGGMCSEYPNWQSDWRRMSETGMHDLTSQWLAKLNQCNAAADCGGLEGWCMFDYNTYHNAYFPDTSAGTGLVKTICTNGLCDLYRIPKFGYFQYVAMTSSTPMVFIANDYVSTSVSLSDGLMHVYSNCDSVELVVNGTSKGMMTKTTSTYPSINHPPFTMALTFQAGTLIALGFKSGAVVATDTVRTPFTAYTLKLEPDYTQIPANGADWTRIVVSVIDSLGTVMPAASNSVSFSITGQGKLIGDNPVTMEAGKLIVLAQSTLTPGTMTVTAASSGLRSASATITTNPATSVIPNKRFETALNMHAPFPAVQYKKVLLGNAAFLSITKNLQSNQVISVFNPSGKMLVKRADKNSMQSMKVFQKAKGIAIVKIETMP